MHAALLIALALPAQAQEYQSPVRLAQAPSYYHADDGDPVTTTHECTHWANSQLRQRYGGGGYYLQAGRFLWIRTKPRITLAQVQPFVRHRGSRFQVYLVDARYPLTPQPMGQNSVLMGHDQDPLHLFDEMSAYTAGAAVAVRDPGAIVGACELAHYAASCLRAAPRGYQDRETLRQIWLTLARRIDTIARRAHARGEYRGVAPWHRVLVSDINQIQRGQ